MATYTRPLSVVFGASATGQAANVQYKVLSTDRSTVLIAATNSGVAESTTEPGTYYATGAVFDVSWSGYVIWSITTMPGYGAEETFVPVPATLVAAGMDNPLLTDPVSNTDVRSSGGKMLRFLVDRFLDEAQSSATQQIIYNDAGTAIATSTVGDDGTTVTKSKST